MEAPPCPPEEPEEKIAATSKRQRTKNKKNKQKLCERERNDKGMEVEEEKSDLQAVNKEMIVWRMNGPAEALLITH